MSLDPKIRQRVAHLYGKTLADLLNDRIDLPPEPERPRMRRRFLLPARWKDFPRH